MEEVVCTLSAESRHREHRVGAANRRGKQTGKHQAGERGGKRAIQSTRHLIAAKFVILPACHLMADRGVVGESSVVREPAVDAE
jgi:hypothetical protein